MVNLGKMPVNDNKNRLAEKGGIRDGINGPTTVSKRANGESPSSRNAATSTQRKQVNSLACAACSEETPLRHALRVKASSLTTRSVVPQWTNRWQTSPVGL